MPISYSIVPEISAKIEPGDSQKQMTGHSFSLTCVVTGTTLLNPVISYQWFKAMSSLMRNDSNPVLSFESLLLSDAENYSCRINVSSPFLNSPHILSTEQVNLPIQSKFYYFMYAAVYVLYMSLSQQLGLLHTPLPSSPAHACKH